jgi:hypothetical protein
VDIATRLLTLGVFGISLPYLSHRDEERRASMEAMMTPPTQLAAMIAVAPVRT